MLPTSCVRLLEGGFGMVSLGVDSLEMVSLGVVLLGVFSLESALLKRDLEGRVSCARIFASALHSKASCSIVSTCWDILATACKAL